MNKTDIVLPIKKPFTDSTSLYSKILDIYIDDDFVKKNGLKSLGKTERSVLVAFMTKKTFSVSQDILNHLEMSPTTFAGKKHILKKKKYILQDDFTGEYSFNKCLDDVVRFIQSSNEGKHCLVTFHKNED